MHAEHLWIATDDGCRLDADLLTPEPDTPVVGGIIVAHPHPLYGGNRQNHVVRALSELAAEAGWVAIRFDFRGVGRSSGEHAKGIGEINDVDAALDHTASLLDDDSPLVSAGYSFGAVMALAAGHPRITHRIAIAAPLGMMTDREPPTEPTLLLVPSQDQYTSPLQARQALESWPATAELHVVEGADHFLNAFGPYVADRAMEWLNASRA
jgi:uncharacterized protein